MIKNGTEEYDYKSDIKCTIAKLKVLLTLWIKLSLNIPEIEVQNPILFCC